MSATSKIVYSSIDHTRAVFLTDKRIKLFEAKNIDVNKVIQYCFKRSMSFDSALIHFEVTA